MLPGKRRRALIAILHGLLAAALAASVGPATAQTRTILRYERLANLSITEPSVGANGEAIGPKLSFEAFGTLFVVRLARNEELTRDLPPAVRQRFAGTEFYTGALDGKPDSWARLTRTGAALSGAIWDGAELYAIEPFERVATQVVAGPSVAPAEPVIYRLADTLSASTDDVVTAAASELKRPMMAASDLAALPTKLNPVQQLDIGLLADAEFVQANGGSAEADMLSIANVVDGIFFNQVGVRINVAELRTYPAEPDPFSGTDASALLGQLGDFKAATPALSDKGLVHLLTGRDLDEPAGTPAGVKLLGLAHLGGLCDARLAVSVTQATNLGAAALVAAHEIGHNFGAPHDAEAGSPCASTPDGFLMNPLLNYSQQFSECSLQQIAAELSRTTCLKNLPANDLSVQPLSAPTAVIVSRAFDVTFAVDFSGVADALDARMTVTYRNLRILSFTSGPPATCTFPSDSDGTCTFPAFGAGGARREFGAEFVADQDGPASIDVEVTALNDYEPSNNRYQFAFNAQPDARFVLEDPGSLYPAVKPGESFDLDWVVRNAGVIAATGVVAQIRFGDRLEFVAVELPNGASCSHDPATFDWFCPVGNVGPGATFPLKLRLRAADIPYLQPGTMTGESVWLVVTAAEPIFNYESSWLGAGVTITPRIADVYVDLTAPASAPVDSKVTLTLRVGNRGPDSVENVNAALHTWTGRGLTFDSATSTRGSCAKDFNGYMVCQIATLASGETIEVTAQATVDSEAGDHDLLGSAGTPLSYDPDRTNNERKMLFSSVAPPPAPPSPSPSPSPPPTPTPPTPAPASGGGGGGGGAGLDLMLLVLVASFARMARRLNRQQEATPLEKP